MTRNGGNQGLGEVPGAWERKLRRSAHVRLRAHVRAQAPAVFAFSLPRSLNPRTPCKAVEISSHQSSPVREVGSMMPSRVACAAGNGTLGRRCDAAVGVAIASTRTRDAAARPGAGRINPSDRNHRRNPFFADSCAFGRVEG